MEKWSKNLNPLFQTPAGAQVLEPLIAFLAQQPLRRIAVGFSGGADSSVLMLALAHLRAQFHYELIPIHVHHGLVPEAEQWLQHADLLCRRLDLPLIWRRVCVPANTGKGVEAAARQARFEAFQEVCAEQEASVLCLAHHLQDQAETILMRLCRGTGINGAGGMHRHARHHGMELWRPLLDVPANILRELAQRWAVLTDWQYIEDPSNADLQYKRGEIRTRLVPILDELWPQWTGSLQRFGRIMQDAAQLNRELADLDLQQVEVAADGKAFSLEKWRQLSPTRQANLLRRWLEIHQQLMPSEKRLQAWMRQLRQVHALGFDREVRLQHQQSWIIVRRGRVMLCRQGER